MKSPIIRKKFLDFFAQNGHTIVASSSLIPTNDPTLLFTNAGMNQFKDVFLGTATRPYTKAVTMQKCMRAGGKHNDLENVGRTTRHLTFFEMMGNFSFNDYFKKGAIELAWKFLTQELNLPEEKLWVTVHNDDQEAYDIWHKVIGLPEEKISRCGDKDNFWQMGDTGPCGPCSEIFYDRGIVTEADARSYPNDDDSERFMEIWNLVFMQYNQQPDGTRKPLEKTGIDTGMGFERIASVMQEKQSVFDSDVFAPIIEKIEQLTGVSYQQATEEQQVAFRVLADHIRSSSFAIADGCLPSNEGRGYVLRKIIRRAALFSQKLTDTCIFPQLVATLAKQMGSVYPELIEKEAHITKLLQQEIEKFEQSLRAGQTILEKYFAQNADTNIISGQQAFKLYDTYGFPLELTNDIAQERNFTVDTVGFEKHMLKQQERSRAKKETQQALPDIAQHLNESFVTTFTGYDECVTQTPVKQVITIDDRLFVIPEKSPLYVESGGQVSDTGTVIYNNESYPVFGVHTLNGTQVLELDRESAIPEKAIISIEVNADQREATTANHSATHLLQAALVNLLGKQIKQAGSFVNAEGLRFDYTYPHALTQEQIKELEDVVNQKIRENIVVALSQTTYQKAIEKGVTALFGEKYDPENVRVVEIPGFSAELCGGTHVARTGDIGCFKIVQDQALSSGVRRISATTGQKALELFQESYITIQALGKTYKVPGSEILGAVEKQAQELKAARAQVQELQKKMLMYSIPTWLAEQEIINTIPVSVITVENVEPLALRDLAQKLMDKKSGIYCLFSQTPEKTYFVIRVASEHLDKIDLKRLKTWLAEFNLRGGGKKDTLQGGGNKIQKDFVLQLKKWFSKNV